MEIELTQEEEKLVNDIIISYERKIIEEKIKNIKWKKGETQRDFGKTILIRGKIKSESNI